MKERVVVIITGLPSTGKTHLGREVASRLDLPFINKDAIKETLFNELGWSDREWSRKLGSTTYGILYYLLDALMPPGVSLVVESNFEADKAGPELAQRIARHGYRVVQVLCKTDGPTLVERFKERSESGERHPGHVDSLAELTPKLLKGRIEPVALPGPLIEVDTTDFDMIDYDTLVDSIRDGLGSQKGDVQE